MRSILAGKASTRVIIRRALWTDNYGNGNLVRIQILAVLAIGCNLFSATRNGIVFIFGRENPWLEGSDVTLLLLREHDEFVLVLSTDDYLIWSNGVDNKQSFQSLDLAPAARLPQQAELGAHEAARRQRYQLRLPHGGL